MTHGSVSPTNLKATVATPATGAATLPDNLLFLMFFLFGTLLENNCFMVALKSTSKVAEVLYFSVSKM